MAGTDERRKQVFRKAAEKWLDSACIELEEKAEGGALNVGTWSSSSCYATKGKVTGENRVNMGYCRDFHHLGNVIHEIGHVIGMDHEHKRLDSTGTYNGHGPYLQIHYNKIPRVWHSQFKTSDKAYLGSAQHGWSLYDYGSIMHYGTIDGAVKPLQAGVTIGQRNKLSDGDISHILDMYQCKLKTHAQFDEEEDDIGMVRFLQ